MAATGDELVTLSQLKSFARLRVETINTSSDIYQELNRGDIVTYQTFLYVPKPWYPICCKTSNSQIAAIVSSVIDSNDNWYVGDIIVIRSTSNVGTPDPIKPNYIKVYCVPLIQE